MPFNFIAVARFLRCKPVVIHVREIPTGLEMRILRALIIFSQATCFFNSEATRLAFDLPAYSRTEVIYNGFSDPGPTPPPDYDGSRSLRLLTIGRINGWKGQEILVSAIGLLSPSERKQVEVRIVGGSFGTQEAFKERLATQIARLGLSESITINPFEHEPADSFRQADVVIVPSTKPEPFGRVAIEAMAFSRPVIASNHGGLAEIVRDGETGQLVVPADPHALAYAIRRHLTEPSLARRQGGMARERFLSSFTSDSYDQALCAAFDRLLRR